MFTTQKSRFAIAAAVLLSLQANPVVAFSPSFQTSYTSSTAIRASNDGANVNTNVDLDTDAELSTTRDMFNHPLRKAVKPFTLALLTAASSAVLMPQTAVASAPVTPIKNFKPPDSKAIALKKINDVRNQEKMKETMAYQIKCEEIEADEGIEARNAYEKAYEDAKIKEAEERAVNRKKLTYSLADMGLCPFVDVEGERQMYIFDNGIDLNKIAATKQQKEFMNLRRDKKLPIRREKERFLVKCIVEDMKLKGQDPVKYLEENQAKTKEILMMKERQLDAVVNRYQELLQTQGSLSGERAEKTFDVAAAIGLAPAVEVDPAAAAKEAKAAEKAKAKAEKEKSKAEAKAAKDVAKAEAKAAKEAAKAEAKAAKEAAVVEAAKEAAEAESVVAAENVADPVSDSIEGETDISSSEIDVVEEQTESGVAEVAVAESTKGGLQGIIAGAPVVPIIAVVGAAGAGIAFKTSQAKKEAEEDERQKQFRLLMGLDNFDDEEDDGGDEDPLDFTSSSDTASSSVTDSSNEKTTSPPPAAAVTPKKKRRGLASVFSKKSTRETDLLNLVASDAKAPAFSTLLSKILTFGAPGRFPTVTSMSGGMPFEKFDLDEAKKMLSESTSESGMTKEVAAEEFACVVNCMIIDIIDLASSSLGMKEKKNSAIIDALNVVMDFMDHAASLFDAVADGVAITPVTYDGTLSKSKLEQMFAIYSSSVMTSMDGSVTQDRVDTLQQVFNINDKRAEGLAQKAMMKNLMGMMKDGGEGMGDMAGMEGLSEMMAAMGGEGGDGMPGMPGMDEEISPEQLKQSVEMMKELIDSGSVSKEELGLVREQFSQMYGSDIDELIKSADEEGGADELGDDGKELLDLFKTILKED